MQKVLVFGGGGLVGSRFVSKNLDQFDISSPPSREVDILQADQILKSLENFQPEVVINFAAFTNVEAAEDEKDDKTGLAYRLNVQAAKDIADVCKKMGVFLIHISTEYVFDGEKKDSPYTEEDSPNPINWYGQTKYFGEQFVLQSGCKCTVVRLSMPYSASFSKKKDIARFFLENLKERQKINAISDQKITPTFVDEIANILKIFITKKTGGIYHLAPKDSTTPFEFAKLIGEIFNIDNLLVTPISLDEFNKNKKAKLLKNSWLDPSKFEQDFEIALHIIKDNLKLFKQEIDSGGGN